MAPAVFLAAKATRSTAEFRRGKGGEARLSSPSTGKTFSIQVEFPSIRAEEKQGHGSAGSGEHRPRILTSKHTRRTRGRSPLRQPPDGCTDRYCNACTTPALPPCNEFLQTLGSAATLGCFAEKPLLPVAPARTTKRSQPHGHGDPKASPTPGATTSTLPQSRAQGLLQSEEKGSHWVQITRGVFIVLYIHILNCRQALSFPLPPLLQSRPWLIPQFEGWARTARGRRGGFGHGGSVEGSVSP